MSDENNKNRKSAYVRKKRRKFKFFIALVILIFIWYFNNFTVKITNEQIFSEKIYSDVRIAVISDLHSTEYGISNKTVIQKICSLSPDIIFVLGDMYSNNSGGEDMQRAIDLITALNTYAAPVYFVEGEHDRQIVYTDALKTNGVHVLNYTNETIYVNGNEIIIYGIDNAYFSPSFDLSNEFSIDNSKYNVLLAHIPMYDYYADFGADLTVSGDTHGGMIQFPFIGPLYYEGEFIPEIIYGRSDIYDKGLFSYEGGYLFITSGLGNYPLPMRFNNRPEIAVITLSPQP